MAEKSQAATAYGNFIKTRLSEMAQLRDPNAGDVAPMRAAENLEAKAQTPLSVALNFSTSGRAPNRPPGMAPFRDRPPHLAAGVANSVLVLTPNGLRTTALEPRGTNQTVVIPQRQPSVRYRTSRGDNQKAQT